MKYLSKKYGLIILLFICVIGLVLVGMIVNSKTKNYLGIESPVEAVVGSEADWSIENKYKELLLLSFPDWENASLESRLSVLQTVINIEACQERIPYSIQVVAADINASRFITAESFTIEIPLNYLNIEDADAGKCMDEILHQFRHILQYCLVQNPEYAKSFADRFSFDLNKMQRETEKYKEEFQDLVSEENKCLAYSKEIESDAIEYSKNNWGDYFSWPLIYEDEKTSIGG